MTFFRITNRAVNFDNVLYCERQVYGDEENVKVYFTGSSNNTPLVLCGDEAKQLWKYLEYAAERPV